MGVLGWTGPLSRLCATFLLWRSLELVRCWTLSCSCLCRGLHLTLHQEAPVFNFHFSTFILGFWQTQRSLFRTAVPNDADAGWVARPMSTSTSRSMTVAPKRLPRGSHGGTVAVTRKPHSMRYSC